MSVRAALSDLLGLRVSSDVARAQVEGLRQRIPFLYAIVSANIVALAFTHRAANPFWVCILLPGMVIAIMLSRIVAWIRLRPKDMTDQEVERTRWTTVIVGTVLGMVTLTWAAGLTRSAVLPPRPGLMTDTGHAVFFVGITILSCVFLLMHNRLAAISVGVCVLIPFAAFLISAHQAIETAIAFNVVVVGTTVLLLAVSYSRQFDKSIVAAADLLSLSAENARQASIDSLTTLPNRREFFRRLEAAGAGVRPFAVLVCDLDGFKQINDVYGHHAGDEVLRQVARRLREATPQPYCLARMGGDEFACLIETDTEAEAQSIPLAIAARMLGQCDEPIACGPFTVRVGGSMGICHSSVATGAAEVYECADYALFEAKRAGRGRIETFNIAHDRSMRRESRVAHVLRGADLERELQPYFQPIVDARSHELGSFEALVR